MIRTGKRRLSFDRRWVIVAFGMLVAVQTPLASAADIESGADWPRFRGAQGTGHGTGTLPQKWDESAVRWVADLPVQGHSSPIVWGDHIFLTGATMAGGGTQRRVVCLDRQSGKVLWNEVAVTGEGEQLHKMNSWATPSCVTDGERVIAFFGVGGLHCFTVDGKRSWELNLGSFDGSWGVGGSPIIHGDLVIQNCDATGDSFLVAVNKKTGKEVWRTDRRAKPKGGWSTPVLIQSDGRDELLLNGEFGVQAYDPTSGEATWFCKSFNGRGTPSPVAGNGLVYVISGKPGDVYAVKPGGKGDVTDSRMIWHTIRKGGRDLPSPILVGNSLFVMSMSGIGSVYDAATGEEIWKSRIGGNFSSSPVAVDNLIYACAEDGTVSVIRGDKDFELLSQNSIGAKAGEVFRSSMAISRSELLIRSDKRLFCVGNAAK
jgi:outer membrane protein assembly factor BamB